MSKTIRAIRATALIVLMAVVPLTAGCNTDYQMGYRQGQKEARELRKELGAFAKPTHQLTEGLGIEPGIDGRSNEWNRGYRQGIRDEFKQ